MDAREDNGWLSGQHGGVASKCNCVVNLYDKLLCCDKESLDVCGLYTENKCEDIKERDRRYGGGGEGEGFVENLRKQVWDGWGGGGEAGSSPSYCWQGSNKYGRKRGRIIMGFLSHSPFPISLRLRVDPDLG